MQRAFQAGSHKSQQLDTDRFEIRSVARSKVAIMIPGLYSIFQDVACGSFSLSRSHKFCCSTFCLPYIKENPEAGAENVFFTY